MPYIRFMETNLKPRLLIPIVIFLTFIILASVKLYNAIGSGDTTRIEMNVFSIITSLAGLVLILRYMVKNNKKG